MADQKRWFKVWTSLAVDMDHQPNDVIGAWTRLGCRTALVGSGGVVTFESWEHLARFWNVTVDCARTLAQALPSVSIEEGKNRHGTVSVTFKNWTKYQEDSTQAERARTSRSKRRGEEKRKDETRGESSPPPISGGSAGEPPRPAPKFSGPPRQVKAIRVGSRKITIPGPVRQVVEAWTVAFERRGFGRPTPPTIRDLEAAEELIELNGVPRVVEIVEGALLVGTNWMRTSDRWSLHTVRDEWNVLVAMQAKGELR